MSAYRDFLKLLAFSDEEIPQLLPQWENACRLLELSEEELDYAANSWLPRYWDLSLLGVRKCIGAYFRELIQLTRLGELKKAGAKILYYNMPSHPACIYANRLAGGDRLHISYPDYIIATVFNAFLHKDTAETKPGMPCASQLCHQCGMNRVKAQERFRNIIAEPTVLWNWGLYCNEGHKIEELLQDTGESGWDYVLTTMPQDAGSALPEAEDEKRVGYLARQLRESQKQVSAYTGIPVGEKELAEATEKYLEYMLKVEALTDLVSRADPQPMSGNELALFWVPAQIALDTGFEYITEAVDTVIGEIKERTEKAEGPLPKGSPRLACHFVPFSVPWINRAFMDNGVNLSVNTFFAQPSRQAEYFQRGDVYRSVARQWLSNPSVVNMQNEAELVCAILERYPQDGVLYGFFDFGCWIGSLKKTMIKIVQERTGIPTYYFESEFWDDGRYSLEDRLDRIKNIAYKVKINHMISGVNNAKKKTAQR